VFCDECFLRTIEAADQCWDSRMMTTPVGSGS
jgi:hypothetical protein